MPDFAFDLFLCHNSQDKAAVVQLKDLLRQRELKAWLDKDQLPPGHGWQPLLKAGLDNSRAIAVCVGQHGVGPWQEEEVQEALRIAVKDKRPVIPVILPSAGDDPQFPAFVTTRTWVDFRQGFTPEALDDLVFGITGVRPEHSAIDRRLARLPQQFHFFGREKELATIREALDPARRTWGVLIDGTGGIGKTALAIRAAYDAPVEWFQRVCFVSAKTHELHPEGKRSRAQFATPTWRDMLTELAAELDLRDEANRAAADKLAPMLERALREQPTLIVFDNLESLSEDDRQRLYEFLGVLPLGSKAIVTSRRRSDLDVRTLRLERLEQAAALAFIAALAEDRPLLRRTTEAERQTLYEETGGNPLLVRWIAGQLGRGKCRAIEDALHLLKNAPPSEDNDALEFIMGDLVQEFTDTEAKAIVALAHFTRPVEVSFIAELTGLSRTAARTALEDLSFRALVNAEADYQRFALAALVGDYLRRVKPEIVEETGQRLVNRAYALAVENGYQKHDRFPVLEENWSLLEAALPLLLAGDNDKLQTLCMALQIFLDFQGRWEVWLSLSLQAENRAMQAGDHAKAGWRAYDKGSAHQRLGEASEVLACAERAAQHWQTSQQQGTTSIREQAVAIALRGLGHELAKDYHAAIAACQESLELHRSLRTESQDIAVALSSLAGAERLSGKLDAAERDYQEALRISKKLDDCGEGIASNTYNLAALALDQEDWPQAEKLARKALVLSEDRKELIASNNHCLARALVRQSRASEALPHAEKAVAIFTDLRSPNLTNAKNTLKEVKIALALAKYRVGWTHNSSALEGNTLTLGETAQVLADPQAFISGKPHEHQVESRNHAAVCDQLAALLRENRDFTTDDLFALHTTLMAGSTIDIYRPIGAWKVEANQTVVKLDGEATINENYATPHHVPALMTVWLEELNFRRTARTPLLDDHVWLHATFARIHPFADGNGRLARLLANVPVLAKGHNPIIIPVTARDRYLENLARWQIACSPPKPNFPLFDQPALLADFRKLCEEATPEGK